MLTLAIVSGLGLGAMYGLIALGFYMTYAVSSTVNFSQGTSVMLGAVLAFVFSQQLEWGIVASVATALAICALWGALVERIAVRPFVRAGSNAWLMSTVAIGIVLENIVLFTFGKEPRSFPSPFSGAHLRLGDVDIYPLQAAIPVIGLAVAFGLALFTRRTRLGQALSAIVQNPAAATLMGINVSVAVTASYAVSTVFAGIAGIMIAPLVSVSADFGTLFGVKAFAVAILGGITSARGVVVAGFIYGLTEALVTAFVGSSYTNILAFALVIVALAFRPHGLFGLAAVKKV
ncbi:MAG: branched-chain amino acid ABC transporter permease [Casimicrobiaceae bacterium]